MRQLAEGIDAERSEAHQGKRGGCQRENSHSREAQREAHQDARRDRDVQRAAFALDVDVSGQTPDAEVREPRPEQANHHS